MKRRSPRLRMSRTVALLALAAVAAGCGGGGSGGGVVPPAPRCLDLLPASQPEPSTVAARKGAASTCDLLEIELVVTDVADVFGASVVVQFPASIAAYESLSASGSFLASDGTQIEVLQEPQSGSVQIGISRIQSDSGVDAVGSRRLLSVILRKLADGGSGSLSYSNERLLDSAQPPQPIPGVTWVGGTLIVR